MPLTFFLALLLFLRRHAFVQDWLLMLLSGNGGGQEEERWPPPPSFPPFLITCCSQLASETGKGESVTTSMEPFSFLKTVCNGRKVVVFPLHDSFLPPPKSTTARLRGQRGREGGAATIYFPFLPFSPRPLPLPMTVWSPNYFCRPPSSSFPCVRRETNLHFPSHLPHNYRQETGGNCKVWLNFLTCCVHCAHLHFFLLVRTKKWCSAMIAGRLKFLFLLFFLPV